MLCDTALIDEFAANVLEIAIEIKIQIPIYYIRPPILIIRIISIIRDSPKLSIIINNNNNNSLYI